jgi:hypothetical protein
MSIKFKYQGYSGREIEVTAKYSEAKNLIKAARDPKFIHARCRNWCHANMTTIYHRDPSSPSGKIAAAGHHDPLVSAILERQNRTSPLSPTEGLNLTHA